MHGRTATALQVPYTYLIAHCKKNLELRNNNLHSNIVAVLTANLNVHIYIYTDRRCYVNRDNYFPAIRSLWLKKIDILQILTLLHGNIQIIIIIKYIHMHGK